MTKLKYLNLCELHFLFLYLRLCPSQVGLATRIPSLHLFLCPTIFLFNFCEFYKYRNFQKYEIQRGTIENNQIPANRVKDCKN